MRRNFKGLGSRTTSKVDEKYLYGVGTSNFCRLLLASVALSAIRGRRYLGCQVPSVLLRTCPDRPGRTLGGFCWNNRGWGTSNLTFSPDPWLLWALLARLSRNEFPLPHCIPGRGTREKKKKKSKKRKDKVSCQGIEQPDQRDHGPGRPPSITWMFFSEQALHCPFQDHQIMIPPLAWLSLFLSLSLSCDFAPVFPPLGTRHPTSHSHTPLSVAPPAVALRSYGAPIIPSARPDGGTVERPQREVAPMRRDTDLPRSMHTLLGRRCMPRGAGWSGRGRVLSHQGCLALPCVEWFLPKSLIGNPLRPRGTSLWDLPSWGL